MTTAAASHDASPSAAPPCIPAPPSPPGGPSDWDAVQGNCFSNLQRLGRWTGGTRSIPSGSDPSGSFASVAAASLGGGDKPPAIYVLAHGWAPGFREAVNRQGGDLLWWGSQASADGIWTSEWAWAPMNSTDPVLVVNPRGFLPSIAAFDPKAIILAYSWIDDSATESGNLNLTEVYRSEAYTHANGLRLADALISAIAPSFWSSGGQLRLIGHSHGSKVATVAALALQHRGFPVAHLTVLDAPESEVTLELNAANLLGYYLQQIQITNPLVVSPGAFVDNYASCFGVAYATTGNLRNIIEVGLEPSEIYHLYDVSSQHSYAAAWYGGAAAGAAAQGEPPLGFAWPPAPVSFRPGFNQTWPNGAHEADQWLLRKGAPAEVYAYQTEPLAVTTVNKRGNVTGDPSTQLVFGSNAVPGEYSIFEGSYYNPATGYGYGMTIDLIWLLPQPGDYLVVTMEAPVERYQEVLLVMDGRSAPWGRTSVAINSAVTSFPFVPVDLYVYFLAGVESRSRVILSNFQRVNVTSASGYLHARRLAAGAQRVERRAERAPRWTPGIHGLMQAGKKESRGT